MNKIWMAALAMSAVALAGCKHTSAYVGTYVAARNPWQARGKAELKALIVKALPPGPGRDSALRSADSDTRGTLVIREDGTYTLRVPKLGEFRGTITVDGNRLTFHGSGDGPTPGNVETMEYSAADQSLTLVPPNPKMGPVVYRKE